MFTRRGMSNMPDCLTNLTAKKFMASSNRSALISKLYKVLKQHYKPMAPTAERPLLEFMLFACCLENAHYDKAEKTYQSLVTSFFDWNEVRVSTVNELSETMKDLPDPATAASNLKCILQTVFEANYSFDLEPLKKQNLGVAIKRLEKLEGASPLRGGFGNAICSGGTFHSARSRRAGSAVHRRHCHRGRTAIGQCRRTGAGDSQKQRNRVWFAAAPIGGRFRRRIRYRPR